MRWERWREAGCVWVAMLRRIPSLFLSAAWIYSENAVLCMARRGRYVMFRITLLFAAIMLPSHKHFISVHKLWSVEIFKRQHWKDVTYILLEEPATGRLDSA